MTYKNHETHPAPGAARRPRRGGPSRAGDPAPSRHGAHANRAQGARPGAGLLPQEPAPDALRRLADKAMGIGSGVVEAANKVLVVQRIKRSGMRWRIRTGQAVLSFRVLQKSDLFDRTRSDLMDVRGAAANENHPLPDRVLAA